jgi:hypothetical protein
LEGVAITEQVAMADAPRNPWLKVLVNHRHAMTWR